MPPEFAKIVADAIAATDIEELDMTAAPEHLVPGDRAARRCTLSALW